MAENERIQLPAREVALEDLRPVPDLMAKPGESETPDDMVVVRTQALREIGLDPQLIERLIRAKVVRGHTEPTCGDYNLV